MLLYAILDHLFLFDLSCGLVDDAGANFLGSTFPDSRTLPKVAVKNLLPLPLHSSGELLQKDVECLDEGQTAKLSLNSTCCSGSLRRERKTI